MTKEKSIGDEAQKKRLRFLDDRASQNLGIAVSRLPGPEWLANVLRTLENFPDCLPSEAVLALHSAASEQAGPMQKLKQYGPQDLFLLDVPERYLWVLGTVPDCVAKLSCGAVIVSLAQELPPYESEAELILACCHEFRHSTLVRRCISTSLAVGNYVNRGTARGEARAVVLPDALLKLEELRGAQDEGRPPADSAARRDSSLLDIVAQALVDELGAPTAHEMRAEADILLAKTVAAKSMSLDTAEEQCQKVYAAATEAQQGMAAAVHMEGNAGLVERVERVIEEAETTTTRIVEAKEALASAQRWSSSAQAIKGDEWFAAWAKFFDQLGMAFGRTRARGTKSRPSMAPSPVKPLALQAAREVALPSLTEDQPARQLKFELGAAAAAKPSALSAAALHVEAPSASVFSAEEVLVPRVAVQIAQALRASETPPANAAAMKLSDAQGSPRSSEKTQVPPPRCDRQSLPGPAPKQALVLDDDARAEDMMALFSKFKVPPIVAAGASGGANKENVSLS